MILIVVYVTTEMVGLNSTTVLAPVMKETYWWGIAIGIPVISMVAVTVVLMVYCHRGRKFCFRVSRNVAVYPPLSLSDLSPEINSDEEEIFDQFISVRQFV